MSRDGGVRSNKNSQGQMTNICINCARALGRCPWSAEGKPVPGWTAEPTQVKQVNTYVDTYHIKACPLFEPDRPRKEKSPWPMIGKL